MTWSGPKCYIQKHDKYEPFYLWSIQEVLDYQDLDYHNPCNTGIYKIFQVIQLLSGLFTLNSSQYHDARTGIFFQLLGTFSVPSKETFCKLRDERKTQLAVAWVQAKFLVTWPNSSSSQGFFPIESQLLSKTIPPLYCIKVIFSNYFLV